MADSNTYSTLDTNLNQSPYFSDYDPSKNYVITLFKPTVGVQTRELNNLQRAFQHQVTRLEQHIFKDGSIVKGGHFNIDVRASYVRIKDQDQYSHDVNVNNFINQEVTSSAGVKAMVKLAIDGEESQTPDTKTLIFKYTSAGSNNESTFSPSDVLSTNTFNCVVLPANSDVGMSSIFTIKEGTFFAKGYNIDFPEATIVLSKYTNIPSCLVGFEVTERIITAEDDNTLYDNASGFPNYAASGADRLQLEIEFKTYNHNDNIPNTFFMLADIENGVLRKANDRPQYADILDEFARRTYETNGDFVVKGMQVKVKNHLNDGTNDGYLYANQGGNSYQLAIGIEPGICFVQGYENRYLVTTWTAIDKGIDVEHSSNTVPVNISYGNYVEVNELFGNFDTNSANLVYLYDKPLYGVSNTTYSSTVVNASAKLIATARVKDVTTTDRNTYNVFLHDIQMQYTTLTGNVAINYGETTVTGDSTLFTTELTTSDLIRLDNEIYGISSITNNTTMELSRAYIYANTTGTIIYKPSGNFKQVRSIYQPIQGDFVSAGADLILTENNAVLVSIGTGTSIYKTNDTSPFAIGDITSTVSTDLYYRKKFISSMNANGECSITTGTAFDQFTFPNMDVSYFDKKTSIEITPLANLVISLPGVISASINTKSIIGVGTSFTKLYPGDNILVNNTDICKIDTITSDTSLTVTENTTSEFAGFSVSKIILHGEQIDMSANSTTGNNRIVTMSNSSTLNFYMNDHLLSFANVEISVPVKKEVATEIKKVRRNDRYVLLDCSNNDYKYFGPWCLGTYDIWDLKEVRMSSTAFSNTTMGTDVTEYFEIKSGQDDYKYGLDYLRVKPSANITISNTTQLLVKFDYMYHDMSQGTSFYNILSYPIDDANTANVNAIRTSDIPAYFSVRDGEQYNLKDCVDARITVESTANDVTSITNITTNPSTVEVIKVPVSGLHTPASSTLMSFEAIHYLGRKDVIGITSQGNVLVVRGQPRVDRITPKLPSNFSALAVIDIPPYPSLTSKEAQRYPYKIEQVGVEQISNRRYTMRDIGVIDKRVKNLEFYAQLSQLETSTKNMQILDENGLNRFKNGIFTDPFTTTSVGDITHVEFRSSIDTLANELRPRFTLNDIALLYNPNNSSNIVRRSRDARLRVFSSNNFSIGQTVTQGNANGVISGVANGVIYVQDINGTFSINTPITNGNNITMVNDIRLPHNSDLVTLSYSSVLYAEQPYATSTTSCAGLEWNWKGTLKLYPEEDVWTDTTTLPDVNITIDANYDVWKDLDASGAWSTTWNSWQSTVTGVKVTELERDVSSKTTTNVTKTPFNPDVWVNSNYNMTNIQYQIIQGIPITRFQFNIFGVDNVRRFHDQNSSKWNASDNLMWSLVFSQHPGLLEMYFSEERGMSFNSTDIVTTTTTTETSINTKQQIDTTTTDTRTGLKQRVTFETQKNGEIVAVTDVSLQPYMRSRVVLFSAVGMKPGARLYPFFDGIDVSEYCAPYSIATVNNGMITMSTSDSSLPSYSSPIATGTEIVTTVVSPRPYTLGDNLYTDANGKLVGVFNLPCDNRRKFAFGTKKFRLSDNMFNSDATGEVTTSAEAYYTAQGLSQDKQKSIISTRYGNIENMDLIDQKSTTTTDIISNTVNLITSSNTVTGPNLRCMVDPIAQEIPMEIEENIDGAFFNKVHLYFSQKDLTQPIEIMFREMDAGHNILQTVVPFSHVMLDPSEVNTSNNASAPTEFHFDALIYLEAKKSYALVIRPTGSNPNYFVYTATLGDRDIITGNPVIRRPYTGNFYVSSNDLGWTIVQTKRLKFKLFRCDFDTSANGVIYFENAPVEVIPVNDMQTFNYAAEPVYGETRLVLSGISNDIVVGEGVTGATSGATGTVAHIDSTNASANVYYISDVAVNDTFEGYVGETLSFSNGATATIANVEVIKSLREFSQNFADTGDGLMILHNCSGTFRNGEQLMSQLTGNTAIVNTSTNIYRLQS